MIRVFRHSDLKRKVYDVTRRIPIGRVTTYGRIARAVGQPKAARAVGMILRFNPHPIVVPCHRVVYSDGRVGGYGGRGGKKRKLELLHAEGVEVMDERIVNFHESLFEEF